MVIDKNILSIGGKEIHVRLKYVQCRKILAHYNRIWARLRREFEKKVGRDFDFKNDRIILPDHFFFWAIWSLMDKRYPWPFRKPFRSMRHMIKSIDFDEARDGVLFVGAKILKVIPDDMVEETEKKN